MSEAVADGQHNELEPGSIRKEPDPEPADARAGCFFPRTPAELAAAGSQDVEWVVEGLLPDSGSFVLLSGFMKTGKSTFLAEMLTSIVQGRPFLGRRVRRSPVLLMAVEELPRDIIRRLRLFGLRDEDPLITHAGRLNDDARSWQEVRALVAEKRPGLIVLDTLNRFWTVRDENDNAQVNREAGKWMELARDTGCSVLLVVHQNKAGGEGGRAIRGGSALLGLADQVLTLEKRSGGVPNQRTLTVLGRYGSVPDIVLRLDAGGWIAEGTVEEMSGQAAVARVRAALAPTPSLVEELAKKAGISARMVRKALSEIPEAVSDGKGRRGDPQKWFIR
jgi:AAA domain